MIHSEQLTNLKVTLLLEPLAPGLVAASVLEFPDCRVEAATREAAIAQLQAAFLGFCAIRFNDMDCRGEALAQFRIVDGQNLKSPMLRP